MSLFTRHRVRTLCGYLCVWLGMYYKYKTPDSRSMSGSPGDRKRLFRGVPCVPRCILCGTNCNYHCATILNMRLFEVRFESWYDYNKKPLPGHLMPKFNLGQMLTALCFPHCLSHLFFKKMNIVCRRDDEFGVLFFSCQKLIIIVCCIAYFLQHVSTTYKKKCQEQLIKQECA